MTPPPLASHAASWTPAGGSLFHSPAQVRHSPTRPPDACHPHHPTPTTTPACLPACLPQAAGPQPEVTLPGTSNRPDALIITLDKLDLFALVDQEMVTSYSPLVGGRTGACHFGSGGLAG
jgi:hypothetical protein